MKLSAPRHAKPRVSNAKKHPSCRLDAVSLLVSALCIAAVRLQWGLRPPKLRRPFWHDLRVGIHTTTDHNVMFAALYRALVPQGRFFVGAAAAGAAVVLLALWGRSCPGLRAVV